MQYIYIANVAQRTFEIASKSRSRGHGDNYNYIESTSTTMSPARDCHVRGTYKGVIKAIIEFSSVQ